MKKPLPIGIEDFKELIENKYFYVDKTMLIKELLDNRSKVSLFMRPRRFGKTLALSMLKYYFEKAYDQEGNEEDNSYLFKGLKILESGADCIKHMGQFPVVSLSLKTAKQPDWEMAYDAILKEIVREYQRHNHILQSGSLLPEERELYRRIREKRSGRIDYATALEFLPRCLEKVYRKKVILLLDEYDVPLENAYLRGFYEQMTDFIRSLFESALKTNPSLEFAVVTGCLYITKESIFTGMNNLEMISLQSVNYAEHFGFTHQETAQLLTDYGIEDKEEEVQRWYNGYLFGKTEVYNPWSLINYVKATQADKGAFPKPYWANTSSNGIVKELIEHAGGSVKQELEQLIAGGTIEKPVHEEITYEEVHRSQDNLWNFLFFTGYLKKQSERFDGETIYLTLSIPNMEVRLIYRDTILEWSDRHIKQKDLTAFYRALLERDTTTLERELSQYLMEMISFYDYKETYYHGFLAGLLKLMNGYTIKSNRESGLGRSGLLLLSAPYAGVAVIIEVKVADTFSKLEAMAQKALCQIEEKRYDAELKAEGYHTFIKYGIAFYKKICRLAVKQEKAP